MPIDKAVEVILFWACVYFAPSLIALGASKRHPQMLAIFMLNLFGGWTVIGWIAAIVWACIKPAPTIQVANPPR